MVDGYYVYFSYARCEDTIRHSFISHLSAEFQRRKPSFEVSSSDEDRVPEELDAAIKKSKVSLVILSEGYISTKWCLDELLKLSRCRLKNDMVVVPVFYGLTKSDLRKQCLKLTKMFPKDRVTELRQALLEIADLPGHASSLERSDSELVEEIVADVRQKLDPTGKIGVYSRLTKIENLLRKQPWGVRSLGIWGMGGIGKTTLAEAAFEQFSPDFEASCFIRDFDPAFQEKGAYGLLEEHLWEKLRLKGPVRREKLRHKRIMAVLDNVHKPLGATTFLGWLDFLGPGSLIIITSRDKQLLVQCRVRNIYEVQGLDRHEALQLLSRRCETDDHDLQTLIDHADGNPLALSIYGREFLAKKQPDLENAVLHLPVEIFDTFKSSYDALSDNEKEIFLLIVCFCRDKDVDNLMQLLAGNRSFPRVGLDVLVDKCLVFISENKVKMHHLIYEVGLKIIRDQREETEMGYRFYNASNIPSLENEIQEIEELKAIPKEVLFASAHSDYIPSLENEIQETEELKAIPKEEDEDIKAIILDTSNFCYKGYVAFHHMYNLRYMRIYNSDKENHDCCLLENPQSQPPEPSLRQDPQSLLAELRLLHWENYPWQSFPRDFDVHFLVELSMPHSKLLRLWGGTQNLEMLKRITLSQSLQLLNVDELQYSPNIEEIDLCGCSKLQSFPDMDESQYLRVVNLSTCAEIKSFPKFPSSIRKLHLEGTSIGDLYFMNHPSKTQGLSDEHNLPEELITSHINEDFSNQDLCKHERTLPDIVTFESLEVLDLSRCSELKEIQSENFPQSLRELYLTETGITKIPPSLCHHLSKLATLVMENCPSLQDLPEGMSDMKSLTTLKLSGCVELKNIKDLPISLRELYLDGTAVIEFPSSLVKNLSQLIILSLENCKKLQLLQLEVANLESLVTLKLSGCLELKVISYFPQNLKEIYLARTAITKLPTSIVTISGLTTLDLKDCKSLQCLPKEMQNLNTLEFFDLSGCGNLNVSDKESKKRHLHMSVPKIFGERAFISKLFEALPFILGYKRNNLSRIFR